MELRGRHYRTDQPITVTIREDVIAAITAEDGGDGLPYIGPGFIDLQINGYNGRDFNQDSSVAGVVAAVQDLWKEGVTRCFPTVVTNDHEAIEQVLSDVSQACQDPAVAHSIAGIHLEGPFISPEDGARGAHPLVHVKAPDWGLFHRWQLAAEHRIAIMTLSPEWPDSEAFIEKVAASGVKVGIGHTSATAEQIHSAVVAGATLSTHLGNGAHLMLPRHSNYIWAQLAEDALWTTLIADGFHLPPSVLKVAIRVKGERAMLVSDAVYLSGRPPGEYHTHIGGDVVLTEQGKLHLADNPQVLAGSAQTLPWGIAHLVSAGLVTLAEAWEMASVRPARFMSLPEQDGLQVGAPADLVVGRVVDNQFVVERTFVQGRPVYG